MLTIFYLFYTACQSISICKRGEQIWSGGLDPVVVLMCMSVV